MGDSLKFFNGKLLTINDALSTCCCDGDNQFYWEAVPCEMISRQRFDGICDEWDQCKFEHRVFMGRQSRCTGDSNLVCECQRFSITQWDILVTGSIGNVIEFEYNGTGSATITWTDTKITIVCDAGTKIIDLTDLTLQIAAIWNLQFSDPDGILDNGDWIINASNTSYLIHVVEPDTVTIPSGNSASFDSRRSGCLPYFENEVGEIVLFNADPTLFAGNLESVLTDLIGTGITVTFNNALSDYDNVNQVYESVVFDITFGGDLCGTQKSNLKFLNAFRNSLNTSNLITGVYGDFESGESYLNVFNYYLTGTDTPCHYDSTLYDNYPAAFDSEISCCPQRGTSIGPNQYIGFDASGYSEQGIAGLTGPWGNLEKTIYLDTLLASKCFQVSPNWFVFSKPGRLSRNYSWNKFLHIGTDCNYGSSGSCSNNDGSASSCTPELFLASFHKNVPWGPFGPYFKGIEGDSDLDPIADPGTHAAWKFPYTTEFNPAGGLAYLSSGDTPRRYGYEYRPYGEIRTKGTWRYTDEIEIKGTINRLIPFYVGTTPDDDKNYFAEVSSGSLSDGFTDLQYPSGQGCGPFILKYSTSGKTVGDFIDEVNDIRFENYPDCPIFSFCVASYDARIIPANKINNTSSQLWQQLKNEVDVTYGGDGPDSDSEKLSGSDIMLFPMSYHDMHEQSDFNIMNTTFNSPLSGVPETLDTPTSSTPESLKPPPICDLFTTDTLRSGNGEFSPRRNEQMWWTPILGSKETVIKISAAESGLEDFAQLLVSVTDKVITINGSGNGFNKSVSLDTDKSASGYTAQSAVDDLNNLTFTRSSSPFDEYNPIVAVTGSQGFDVYLDDGTYDNGSSYSYGTGVTPTDINYSYREPLEDFSVTNILNSTSAMLKSWIRRRCGEDDAPNYCVPPSSPIVKNTDTVNCEDDSVIINNWLYSYGCDSYNCKTQYYVKSQRCTCGEVWRCDDDNNGYDAPHPLNQPGDSILSQSLGLAISQPDVYVCEHNFHPDCSFKMMIKPPFQMHALQEYSPSLCDSLDEGDLAFQMGTFGAYVRTARNNWFTYTATCLPFYADYCSNSNLASKVASAFKGWCQYIDPINGPRVREEDIPRSTPAKSIVFRRNTGGFCSTKPWNFDPVAIYSGNMPGVNSVQYGCKDTAALDACDPDFDAGEGYDCSLCNEWPCPDCGHWDRMTEGIAFLEDEESPEILTVLFRAGISNITGDTICQNGNCDSWDVDCRQACCECFPTCNQGTECYDEINRHPYQQLSTFLEDRVFTLPGECSFDFDAACNQGFNCVNGAPRKGTNGTCTFTQTTNLTRVATTCNCFVVGNKIEEVECDIDCQCVEDAFADDNPCNVRNIQPVEPDPSDPITYTCSNFPPPIPDNLNCGTATRIDGQRNFNSCSIRTDYIREICSTGTIGNCAQYQADWTGSEITYYDGVSPIDGIELGIFDICEYNIDTTDNRLGSYTVGPTVYTACPFFGPSFDVDYSTLIYWKENLDISCDQVNKAVATGVLTSDPRFLGESGC